MPAPAIHHTFAPHADWRYCLRTLALIVRPSRWKDGEARGELRTALRQQFGAEPFLFYSGRESLVALFRALHLVKGEEIIVQAYTCVVIPNAIQAAGGVPIYADIERETLNLDLEDVERKITPHTRAIICQHTFAIPADTAALRALCDRYHLLLIEDCAHVMPDATGPGEIARLGDFVLFSFGRDKAISGITGGAILSRRREISSALKEQEESATDASALTVFRLLLYPFVYAKARVLFRLGLGTAFLWMARQIGTLLPILTTAEKHGVMSPALRKLPNACAALALAQLRTLEKLNDHRRALARYYLHACAERGWKPLAAVSADLPLQKFPLFFTGADRLRKALKKQNIFLDDGWTGCVVCPSTIDLDPTHYIPGSDPDAEAACEMILSLPTHPTMSLEQAKILVSNLSELTPQTA